METKVVFKSLVLSAYLLTFCQATFADDSMWRNSCKNTGARAHRYVLDAGVKFFPNADQLQSRLNQLNASLFCDCIFDRMNSAFGSTHLTEMMQYGYSPSPEQLVKEKAEKDRIYFACFGQQIGQPNLSPPTPNENTIKNMFKNPLSKALGQKETQQTVNKLLSQITTALQIYQATQQKWPKNLQELTVPAQGLLKTSDLKDPWGHAIIYRNQAGKVELRSAGPDGQADTADDTIKTITP